MRTAFIVLSTRCNNSCGFCFYKQHPEWRLDQSMDRVLFNKALADLERIVVELLILTGGEPLLTPDLIGMISDATSMGFEVQLITNGRLLDNEKVQALAKAGLGVLILSLNDFHQPHSSIVREIPESLKERVASISSVFPGRLSLIFVFTRQTMALAQKAYELALGMGLGIIIQPAYMAEDDPDRQALSPFLAPPEEWDALMQGLRPYFEGHGLRQYRGYIEGLYSQQTPTLPSPASGGGLGRGPAEGPAACFMGSSGMVLDADGKIYACFHRRDLVAGRIGVDSPDRISARLHQAHFRVRNAQCFGEHCISMFVQ